MLTLGSGIGVGRTKDTFSDTNTNLKIRAPTVNDV